MAPMANTWYRIKYHGHVYTRGDEVFGCLPYDRGTYDYRRGILEESGGAATNGGVQTLNLVQRPARPTPVARRARKFN